jgi:hypothetical protein
VLEIASSKLIIIFMKKFAKRKQKMNIMLKRRKINFSPVGHQVELRLLNKRIIEGEAFKAFIRVEKKKGKAANKDRLSKC